MKCLSQEMSFFDCLRAFLKSAKPVQSRTQPLIAKPAAEALPDSGWSPVSPIWGFSGIQVEEVEQGEFVHEWSELMAQEAENRHPDKDEEHAVDRRLPNFDRRRGSHDRRKTDRRETT